MMQKKYNQYGMGALLAYLACAVNILLGILYTPWMINTIGKSDYGLYTLANSLISLVTIDIGLGTAASRYVARYRAQKHEELIPGFLSAIYMLYLIIDVVILAVLTVLFFSIDSIYVNLSSVELSRFKIVFCIAGIYSVLNFPCTTFNGILNAYEQFVPLKTADMAQKIGSVLLTVAALWMGMGLYALVVVQALSGCCANLVKFVFIRKVSSFRFSKFDPGIYKSIFSISFWSCVYGLAQRLVFNITPTIMAMVVSDAANAIAVFGVVTTIESYCYILTTAINGMFLGKISRILQKTDSEKELNTLAITVGRFQFAFNGLIVVGFALMGKDFLNLWMGHGFDEAYYGILLVTIPGLFYNALQIFHSTMVAQNMVKDQALIQIAMGVINIVLSFVFSYMWGVIGATISIFVAYSIRVVLVLFVVQKKIRVNILTYIRDCYMKMGIPLLLTGVVLGVLLPHNEGEGWLVFFVKVAAVTVFYCIMQVLFGLSKEERRMLKEKLHI